MRWFRQFAGGLSWWKVGLGIIGSILGGIGWLIFRLRRSEEEYEKLEIFLDSHHLDRLQSSSYDDWYRLEIFRMKYFDFILARAHIADEDLIYTFETHLREMGAEDWRVLMERMKVKRFAKNWDEFIASIVDYYRVQVNVRRRHIRRIG